MEMVFIKNKNVGTSVSLALASTVARPLVISLVICVIFTNEVLYKHTDIVFVLFRYL